METATLQDGDGDALGDDGDGLERPASPRRICAVTRGFQTTTRDLSVFPFLPRHYHVTHVLLLPFVTTVWTPVVLAIINII